MSTREDIGYGATPRQPIPAAADTALPRRASSTTGSPTSEDRTKDAALAVAEDGTELVEAVGRGGACG